MTERERFIKALKREPIEGHCPTFELVFFLTLEAIGRIHPSQLHFGQWKQMTDRERQAFELVYRRGWAHEDAAAEMYCSRSTVDRALASIRKRNM